MKNNNIFSLSSQEKDIALRKWAYDDADPLGRSPIEVTQQQDAAAQDLINSASAALANTIHTLQAQLEDLETQGQSYATIGDALNAIGSIKVTLDFANDALKTWAKSKNVSDQIGYKPDNV